MRTNIDIDDQIIAQIFTYGGQKTKKEVVNEALKLYLRKIIFEKLEEMRGPGSWEGNLDEMRTIDHDPF